MSLFGLFKEKDSSYYFNKGRRLFDREDYYNALLNFEKAIEKGCNADLKDEIEIFIEKCKISLASKNLELAKAYFEAQDFDEARDFAETCLKYAIDEAVKGEAEGIIKEIERINVELTTGSERDFVYEDVDDDEYYEIISVNYPEFVKNEIDKNRKLKEMAIAINRGELEKGKEIMEMGSSPATSYLKVLYLSLKEDYESAFEIFYRLFKDKGNEFSETMLCEYLELLRRLDRDDELIEEVLVISENSLDVVKLAASIYLERGDLSRSEELVEYGFELMDKFNPDEELIATAGIMYFNKGDYKKCIDYLGGLKDGYAMRGYFAFPKEMAIPLAISYAKTGKPNDALELLLHLVKHIRDKEVIAIASEIAKDSDREDLKRQLKYLGEQ